MFSLLLQFIISLKQNWFNNALALLSESFLWSYSNMESLSPGGVIKTHMFLPVITKMSSTSESQDSLFYTSQLLFIHRNVSSPDAPIHDQGRSSQTKIWERGKGGRWTESRRDSLNEIHPWDPQGPIPKPELDMWCCLNELNERIKNE